MKKKKRKLVRVKFINNEDPKQILQCTINGEYYELRNGQEYDLPIDVINHLNSVAIPIYEYVKDEEAGQMVSEKVGERNRFSCVPVMTAEQMAAMQDLEEDGESNAVDTGKDQGKDKKTVGKAK